MTNIFEQASRKALRFQTVKGELTVVSSGKTEVFEAVKPLLEKIAKEKAERKAKKVARTFKKKPQ